MKLWTHSADQLPAYQPLPLTPTRKRRHELLDRAPESVLERTYQEALRQSLARENQYKTSVIELQSAHVLQSIHCNRITNKLAAQEEKQREGKKKRGKLMGDGLPKLLTGEAFYNRVIEFEKAAEDEEVQRQNRKKQQESRAEALETWKGADTERRERNKARTEAYKEDLEAWKAERDLAKSEKRRPHWSQPKRGKLEAPLPKPTIESVDNGEGREGNEGDDGSGDSVLGLAQVMVLRR